MRNERKLKEALGFAPRLFFVQKNSTNVQKNQNNYQQQIITTTFSLKINKN
jgi:hypothetical protein